MSSAGISHPLISPRMNFMIVSCLTGNNLWVMCLRSAPYLRRVAPDVFCQLAMLPVLDHVTDWDEERWLIYHQEMQPGLYLEDRCGLAQFQSRNSGPLAVILNPYARASYIVPGGKDAIAC